MNSDLSNLSRADLENTHNLDPIRSKQALSPIALDQFNLLSIKEKLLYGVVLSAIETNSVNPGYYTEALYQIGVDFYMLETNSHNSIEGNNPVKQFGPPGILPWSITFFEIGSNFSSPNYRNYKNFDPQFSFKTEEDLAPIIKNLYASNLDFGYSSEINFFIVKNHNVIDGTFYTVQIGHKFYYALQDELYDDAADIRAKEIMQIK